MKTITNKFKIALVAVGLLAIGTANAQTTDPSDNVAQSDSEGPSIRLIDNKGTIKYLQSNNGITTITSTEAGNRTTTTWQLGGTLTSNTYITASGTAEFALDGLELLDGTATASTNAVDRESAEGGGATGTGFTILLRDEATGAIKKISASDLLEVQSSRHEFTGIETGVPGATEIIIATAKDLTGSPTGLLAKNVSVYRNGAKLLAGTDYTLADNGGGTLTQLTLVDQSGATSPADWTLYAGDIIEVHWVK